MSAARSGLFAVGMLLCAGCAHGPSHSEREDAAFAIAELYPLAVGNRWTYDVEFLGKKHQSVVEIVGTDKGYYLHRRTPGEEQGGEDKLMVDGFGLRDEKRYLLRDPLEPGKGWTNVVSPSSVEHYTVLDAGNPCEVPAGKFEGCVRVEARNRVSQEATLVNEMTFAPKVGIVRVFVWAQARGKRIPQTELTLRRFETAAQR